jgi:hypothetical protein
MSDDMDGAEPQALPVLYKVLVKGKSPHTQYRVETEGEVKCLRDSVGEYIARKVRLVRRVDAAEADGLFGVEPPAVPLYKVLEDGKSRNDYAWSLPTKVGRVSTPGAWHRVEDGPLVVCGNGLHLTKDPKQRLYGGKTNPEVYIAEVRGKVVLSENQGDELVAREVRLVRRLSWKEMKHLGIVRGSMPPRERSSHVLTMLTYLVDKSVKASDRKLGYAVELGIKALVKARVKFQRDDFEAIARNKYLRLWCACEDNGESLYSFLIKQANESALKSFESWKGRKPFVICGTRVHLGAVFHWGGGGKNGTMFKVTTFDDEAHTMTVRSWRHEQSKTKTWWGHEYRSLLGKQVVLTHAAIAEAEAARVLSVKLANEAKRLKEVLRYPAEVDVAEDQVAAWTKEERAAAFAYVKAYEEKGWGKPPPPLPAFMKAAVDERARHERRVRLHTEIQRKKWASGDRQGKRWEFEIEVTEAEIDAADAADVARERLLAKRSTRAA